MTTNYESRVENEIKELIKQRSFHYIQIKSSPGLHKDQQSHVSILETIFPILTAKYQKRDTILAKLSTIDSYYRLLKSYTPPS